MVMEILEEKQNDAGSEEEAKPEKPKSKRKQKAADSDDDDEVCSLPLNYKLIVILQLISF